MTVRLLHGDCVQVMGDELDADTVDAIVCDPPYGLEFMGRAWDSFRVDDPGTGRYRGDRAGVHGEAGAGDGTHAARGRGAVAYGGGKRAATYRCTGCGKRDQRRGDHACDARWARELVDPHAAPPTMLAFGEWCRTWAAAAYRVAKPGAHLVAFGGTRTHHRLMQGVEDAGWEIRDCGVWLYRSGFPKSLDVAKALDKSAGVWRGRAGEVETGNGAMAGANYTRTDKAAPATAEARQWDGWGTALKPALEPWVLARKPLSESSVAANVQRWGTGALNIDGCRIGLTGGTRQAGDQRVRVALRRGDDGHSTVESIDAGRWPANAVTLDDDPELRHFRAAGGQVADFAKAGTAEKPWDRDAQTNQVVCTECGDASYWYSADGCAKCGGRRQHRPDDVLHPTVKPLALMRHLVRLVTPPRGLVLDPFAGTGTTGEAALIEGFRPVLIEAHEPYLDLIRARLSKPLQPTLGA